MRIDRWLWVARFFRSRALAKTAIDGGKVLMLAPQAATTSPAGGPGNGPARGTRPKPGRDIAPGDRLQIQRGDTVQTIIVTGTTPQRGSATLAATLYVETPESIEAREAERARRLYQRAGLIIPPARPDRRERRERLRLEEDSLRLEEDSLRLEEERLRLEENSLRPTDDHPELDAGVPPPRPPAIRPENSHD